MDQRTFRLVGTALVIGAVLGLIFSLIGTVFTWRLAPTLKKGLDENLALAHSMLATTGQGLDVAGKSLETSIASLDTLEETVGAASETLNAGSPTLATLQKLMREDLPATVQSTQASLASAKESAGIIDGTLRALSSLPFVDYEPPVPLQTTIENVSNSLNTYPQAFDEIAANLKTTGDQLEIIRGDVDLMASDIGEIQSSLETAQTVIADYQSVVAELEAKVTGLKNRLPPLLTLLPWVLTLVFLWMATAQIGLLFQGWELLERVAGRDYRAQ